MRFATVAEIRELPFVGTLFADILGSLGITDEDLPDIVPDDLDYDDPETIPRWFPKVFAKIEGLK